MLEGFHAIKRALAGSKKLQRRVHELTPSQWLAVSVIARTEAASVKDIREALGVSSSAVTQLVQELEKGGYVEKHLDPSDRRSQRITLSSAARRAADSMKRSMLAHADKLFSALDDAEFAVYVALHKKVVTNITRTL
jgi:DNA-binding MarR family transcriptional regulator